MRADIGLAGGIGFVIGAALFAAAVKLSGSLPLLVDSDGLAMFAFVVFLLAELAEMPLMVVGLRQMMRSAEPVRLLVLGADAGYVAFAAFYASVFVLATGRLAGALVLGALGLLRFASGMLIH